MKTNKRTSGQTLIEFTLVFPLLIFLIFGLFDLGRVVFYYATLNTAVREATRSASVLDTSTPNKYSVIEAKLKEYLWVKELKDNCQIADNPICVITPSYLDTTRPSDPDLPFDPRISVEVTYNFEPITPGISLLAGPGGKIPLKVESVMFLAPVAKPE